MRMWWGFILFTGMALHGMHNDKVEIIYIKKHIRAAREWPNAHKKRFVQDSILYFHNRLIGYCEMLFDPDFDKEATSFYYHLITRDLLLTAELDQYEVPEWEPDGPHIKKALHHLKHRLELQS